MQTPNQSVKQPLINVILSKLAAFSLKFVSFDILDSLFRPTCKVDWKNKMLTSFFFVGKNAKLLAAD